ncbi:multicilin-like [Hemicordylus capensis]|uniref:multicilin-like n=1 Tax=Hemicordylus capensis TaxID=884348 RepID=UPI0023040C21|nr:multicilin-like [Hemicordylus capensis]
MQNRGGGRQAFGSLCPNRVHDLAERLAKKPGKVEKKVPRKTHTTRSNNPVAIYNDPSPDSVDLAFATIDWQDLADCTSVFQQEVSRDNTTQQVTDRPLLPSPCRTDLAAAFFARHQARMRAAFARPEVPLQGLFRSQCLSPGASTLQREAGYLTFPKVEKWQ